jgi:hypothetical protein
LAVKNTHPPFEGCELTNRTGSPDYLRTITTVRLAVGFPTSRDSKSNTAFAQRGRHDGSLAKVKDTRRA